MVTQPHPHSSTAYLAVTLMISLILLCAGRVWGTPTVLHVATERQTSLALNYAYFPQFARVGFGSPEAPWHTWYGSRELRVILYLPGHQPGQEIEVSPATIIGSRFGGKVWDSGFDALRSFDADQNGIVERDELRDLYLWRDFESDGRIAPVDLEEAQWTLVPVSTDHAGFDLRRPASIKTGYARRGRLAPHTLIMRSKTRIHLLDLPITGQFARQHLGYLSYADGRSEADHADISPHPDWSGIWEWQVSNETDWISDYPTWDDRPGGQLLLDIRNGKVRGVVQYKGRHGDWINLPLQGQLSGRTVTWTSVSPLGLTRSEVTLSQEIGRRVLNGEAWSNRNGKLQRWHWKATYVEPFK